MKLREILDYIDEREGLQFWLGWSFLMAFIVITGISVYQCEGREEQQEKQIADIVNECKSTARAYDFVTSHKLLDQLESNDYVSNNTYEETFDYVFNAEAMYLCARGDEESLNRVTFLLSSIPIKGVALPDGFKYTRYYDINISQRDKHNLYVNNVTRYNQKCNTLIDLGISNHSMELIERVIPLYKEVPSLIVDTESETVKVIQYSNKDQIYAKAKVAKAKKEGLLKKKD